MHEKTINQRFNEGEARIRNLERVKLDAVLFESELDHRDTIVNDVRIVFDSEQERYLLEYTVTKPLSGVHEKKTYPIDSPNYSVKVYRNATGIHIEAYPEVDGITIGYNEQKKLSSLSARPDTDETTIEYDALDKLHVKDGSIGEAQLSEVWKNAQESKNGEVEEKIENLSETKADKVFSLDPATGAETIENLYDVQQSLLRTQAELAETAEELADEIGRVETDLDAAKEDKSPNDGKLYGLKDGGKEEITPGFFGVLNAVDGVAPNAAGAVYLDAAHRIHDSTTQKIYEAVPPGGFVGVIGFDRDTAPTASAAVEEILFEDDEGNQFALRTRADGFLIATHPDNTTETIIWRPDYGWQMTNYHINAALVSYTPLTADVWNYVFLTNTVDLIDVRNAALQKTDADFNVVTSVVPRKLYETTVLEENVKNPVTGITQQYIRYIPLADEVNSGLMPRESMRSLRLAKADIETLKGVGRVAANLGLTPAQSALDNAWKTGKNTQTITEGATVVNLDQDPPLGHSWTYLTDADTGTAEWIDRGTDIVNTASNDHEGVVIGDAATQGKVAVNPDGSMSVNGWAENVRRMPAGIIVHSAATNPAAQRLLPLEGQTISIAEGTLYADLGNAVSKGSGTGVFYKNGNNMLLPNYRGLFLRGSGSQSITEYGYSGTHNGGNIGEKHGDAIRNIAGQIQLNERDGDHASGAIYKGNYFPNSGTPEYIDTTDTPLLMFNASRVVPVDSTNHPAFGVGRICISY